MAGQVASASTTIQAPAKEVWRALTEPDLIKKYMFGSEVQTDWREGSPITWRGEYEGKAYEDKGEILEVVPGKRLRMTHYSPLSGAEDKPENYHELVYDIRDGAGQTELVLEQDGNASAEEAQHSTQTWQTMLDSLKQVVEAGT